MADLWKGTDHRPIVTVLKSYLASLVESKSKHAESRADETRREIDRRMNDKRFWINVKHVGTQEEPFLWNDIQTLYMKEMHEFEVRVRLDLLKKYETPEAACAAFGVKSFAEAHSISMGIRENERSRITYEHAVRVVTAGAVDGAEAVQRIMRIGKGGLLIHAIAEVTDFQEVSPSLGEA